VPATVAAGHLLELELFVLVEDDGRDVFVGSARHAVRGHFGFDECSRWVVETHPMAKFVHL
jgi:hypothetical protein